ncbi:MAG: gamma-glutamylcyclotransferase [Isosphaeraceae bacterium]|nr:gamma-glutamylcyclotransferase [Isosphaeraceae bacterium]
MRADQPDLLFAYGTLAPRSAAEAASGGWLEDEMRGRLFDLGPYPALVDLNDPSARWVKGYVRYTDLDELGGRLDAYEGVGEGLYRRVAATTRAGRRAWVYVYALPLPAGARELPEGRWRSTSHPGV